MRFAFFDISLTLRACSDLLRLTTSPFLFLVRSLDDAEAEAVKMIGGGGLTTPEFARLFQRPLDGRTNHVHDGELASRVNLANVDDDAGTSKKQKCAVAKGGQVRTRRAAKDAVEADGEREGGSDDDARSCSYTPSPVRAKAGAGSSASPMTSPVQMCY